MSPRDMGRANVSDTGVEGNATFSHMSYVDSSGTYGSMLRHKRAGVGLRSDHSGYWGAFTGLDWELLGCPVSPG